MDIDDTPTLRYGHKVEGVGIHRNPTAVHRTLTAAENFAEKLSLKHFLQVRIIATKLKKSYGSFIN